MGRKKRPKPVQTTFAVGLEGVGGVIQAVAKQDSNIKVGQAVD